MISIIIAAKDPSDKFLARCIASFAALQTSNNLEVCIVLSGNISPHWENSDFPFRRFFIVRTEPHGVYAAYNLGVELTSGSHLLFFGVDDIALPEMDNVIDCLTTNDADILVGTCVSQLHGVLTGTKWFPMLLLKNWCHQGIFYKREVFHDLSYELKYRIQADHFLNIQIVSRPGVNIKLWRPPVAYFSAGGISSLSTDYVFRNDLPKIAREHFGVFWALIVILKQQIADARRKVFGSLLISRDGNT